MCWLNTDSEHVCDVAIVGEHHRLGWRAAKALFENQIDFNYLDVDDLRDASLLRDGVHVAGQHYRALIFDGEPYDDFEAMRREIRQTMPVIEWGDDTDACLDKLRAAITPDVWVSPAYEGLRVRHVRKAGFDWYMLFNETAQTVDLTVEVAALGASRVYDPYSNASLPFDGGLRLLGHEMRVVAVKRRGELP